MKTSVHPEGTFQNHAAVDAHIEDVATSIPGAYAYSVTFGEVTIYQAPSPSKLADFLTSEGRKEVYWKGQWRAFSEAVRIREQNRGIGEG